LQDSVWVAELAPYISCCYESVVCWGNVTRWP